MSDNDEKNKRKTKLLIITLIAVIAVLLVGVVYQFVTIKHLEKLENENSAIVKVVDNNNKTI